MVAKNKIPIYSLSSFSTADDSAKQYQVELFDAKRHFQVTYPHRHDFYEVLYITQGSGQHIIDSNSYDIQPPCLFFLSPGQAHKLALSHDIRGYIFIFAADFYLINKSNQNRLLEFPFFFTLHQDNPPLLLEGNDEQHFIELLFRRAISENPKRTAESEALLRSILDTLLVTSANHYNAGQKLTSGKGHILAKRFLLMVEENYTQNWPVNLYAEQLAVTPNHLTQTLKTLTGKTSNELIQIKQVLEVKRLLVHTNMSATQIAEHMNFADQSYFTKFFKKQTGKTPLQFRKEKSN